jgi:hypothetical protein
MCEDTGCPSCGPAQDKYKCIICGVWADTGCDHLDEETGMFKPEYQEEANKIMIADMLAHKTYADEWAANEAMMHSEGEE